eukprot:gene17266-23583_t
MQKLHLTNGTLGQMAVADFVRRRTVFTGPVDDPYIFLIRLQQSTTATTDVHFDASAHMIAESDLDFRYAGLLRRTPPQHCCCWRPCVVDDKSSATADHFIEVVHDVVKPKILHRAPCNG